MKIAIIDSVGLPYDETTPSHRGLGGSESAVIYMAKALQDLGFQVTIYNKTWRMDTLEESGVRYRGLLTIGPTEVLESCDIAISSRSACPFLPDQPHIPAPIHRLCKSAAYRVVWMHDTFCQGDSALERLVTTGQIDRIFTLSDFHTSYVTTCEHGPRRNFEVLKPYIFMTRNGINRVPGFVDITQKDPNLFVYNASITKGMKPLVNDIWPKIKERLPSARLEVIGGYYENSAGAPDQQQLDWQVLQARSDLRALDVHFTGVITQAQVADILKRAKFMLYPAAFPETFGISTLEALAYNTPLITNTFGALEETAIDLACYKLPYAIEANSLFPHIDHAAQVNLFVGLVLRAVSDSYLYGQKAHYCSIVHEVCEWSTVALQWKQHFYRVFKRHLPKQEYRRVMHINQRVREIFGRRFSNPEDQVIYKRPETTRFVVISPFYNAEKYLRRCVESVAAQDYDNYAHIMIDDASTDESGEVLKALMRDPTVDAERVITITRKENYGSVYNYVNAVHDSLVRDADVIVMLDGDDALMPDAQIFSRLNALYQDGAEMTYGSMWSLADKIPLIAQEYPPEVRQQKRYRQHRFAWNMPYTHLRTFRAHLLKSVHKRRFMAHDQWMRAGGDTAIFYSVIEAAHPDRIVAVKDILYEYNDLNPINDYKVNAAEQTATANAVLNHRTKKILLAIPTAKYIEPETFQSIYNLDVPGGYEVDFQFFYGYQIDQIRNLIAHWTVTKNYDYLFSVDSDIVLPPDALRKMLAHDKDIISGVYLQRVEVPTPELFRMRTMPEVGMRHLTLHEVQSAEASNPLLWIDACGFGCVLVKREVFAAVGYPYFTYHSALDHANTVSEDVDFCFKAVKIGFQLFADTTIRCQHKGTRWHTIP